MSFRLGYEIEFLGSENKDHIRSNLSDCFGYHWYGANDSKRHYQKWHIKNDRSIQLINEDEKNLCPQEIVSPVMNIEPAILSLENTLKWLDSVNYKTNNSTGLHINLSFIDTIKILNVSRWRLIMLLDELKLLNEWNRSDNAYCRPHALAILSNSYFDNVDYFENLNEQILNRIVDQSKYRTVNFSKLSHGYLEFRIIGGDNYHQKIGYIFNTIQNFISSLDDSCATGNEIQYKENYHNWLDMIRKKDLPLASFSDPETARPRWHHNFQYQPYAYRG